MLGDDLKTMLQLIDDSDLIEEDYERMLQILSKEVSDDTES